MKKKIYLISFAHFIHDIYSSFLAPILPILIEKLQLTYSLAGLLTIFFRSPSLFNPFIGLIIEKAGLKYFIIITPFLTAFTICFLGVVTNYYILAVLLILAGISAQFFHVPAPVVIKKISNGNTGIGMSFFMIGGESARTVGPIIIMTFVSIVGFDNIFVLIPFGFMISLLLYYQLKDIPDNYNNKSDKIEVKTAFKALNKLKKLFIVVFGVMLCKGFTASIIGAYLPIYLVENGLSLFVSGSSLSIVALSGVLGIMVTGPLSDKIGRKKVLFLTSIFSPIAMLLFLQSDGWMVFFLLFILGFVAFSSSPVIMALVQDLGGDIPAMVNGLFMTINFIIGAIIVMFAGKLSDYIGLNSTFYFCAFASFSGLPFLFFLSEKKLSR
jgi:FSR family fosmidomycin resistance protein-like MFS transporter